MDTVITGLVMGLGMLWVIWPFRAALLPYRAYIDLGLLVLLVYLIITVRSNMVVGITTYAGFTISGGLRIMNWWMTRRE